MRSRIPGSFRDPNGFLFNQDGHLYRQINSSYSLNYDCLITSGLYNKLTVQELLIPHQEVNLAGEERAYKVIQPVTIPFISYPYEWSFPQLKDAALTTLAIQKIALDFGMCLKDSSAYNIQFYQGRPIFIDTLSFEKYIDGQPWVAYRQFCQHFLAPLALMRYKDIRFNMLLKEYIDGIPLDLTSSLLPLPTKFSLPLLSHIHLHAKSQKIFSDKKIVQKKINMNKFSLYGLVDSLESAISKLNIKSQGTEWEDYYQDTNYSNPGFHHKIQLVNEFLDQINPKNVWDLGANTGLFSRLASDKGIFTLSFDADRAAVEKNYLECKRKNEKHILPLLMDLANPSPSIGWQNNERLSLLDRGPADTIIALALIHHLAISNNLPLARLAEFFSTLCSSLIIEFVPKTDSQIQRMMTVREDIFKDYKIEVFEKEFSRHFKIIKSEIIRDSERKLFLMIKNHEK